MKAMIFAAGLGTRLLPLTRTIPKALVEVHGRPLLQSLLEKLKSSGIRDVIINIHHHGDLVLDFLQKNENFGMNLSISDERDLLLDTGGGLKKAAWFFDDGGPLLLHNVDVITDLDLKEMISFHGSSGALATLAVRSRQSSRYLLFNDKMHLKGWENTATGERIIVPGESDLNRYAFSGIHILEPGFLDRLKGSGPFSIIDCYLEAAVSHTIGGYLHDHSGWIDVGRPADLDRAGSEPNNPLSP